MSEGRLSKARQKIDAIDQQIFSLLRRRAALALKIGQIKKDQHLPLARDADREAEILERILKNNNSVLSNEALITIFHHIMEACLKAQHSFLSAFE